MCWLLLLHEFDIDIKDKKGVKNPMADHLSRIEPQDIGKFELTDSFPDEKLLSCVLSCKAELPWFSDFANFLAGGCIPPDFKNRYQKTKFFEEIHNYFWDPPFLFNICADNIIRCCVSHEEANKIVEQCHASPYGGHHGPSRTAHKILESGF